jgi:hypothetical protein
MAGRRLSAATTEKGASNRRWLIAAIGHPMEVTRLRRVPDATGLGAPRFDEGYFSPLPKFQLDVYREALLIFYGKANVYLRRSGGSVRINGGTGSADRTIRNRRRRPVMPQTCRRSQAPCPGILCSLPQRWFRAGIAVVARRC